MHAIHFFPNLAPTTNKNRITAYVGLQGLTEICKIKKNVLKNMFHSFFNDLCSLNIELAIKQDTYSFQ